MRYKLVIFDFDGTLADSLDCFLTAVNEAAQKFRFRPIEPAAVEEVRGWRAIDILAYLDLPLWKVPRVSRAMRQLMAEHIDSVRLFPGVDGLLATLAAQGVEIAVITSNSLENVRRVLGEENAALVRHFGCGTSMFGKKSKLKRLLKQSGFAPEDTLCIGDEIRDADAARAAGIRFAGVAWGYTRPNILQRHSRYPLIHSAADVLKVLRRRRPGQRADIYSD